MLYPESRVQDKMSLKKEIMWGCKVGFAFFEDLSGRKSAFLEEKWVMKLF